MSARLVQRRRSSRPRERLRRRNDQAAALLRALQQVYASAREDPLQAAVRQRLGR